MTVKQSTGKQFACKMINLRVKICGSEHDEEGESSEFFTASALQPTKAIEPRTAGFEKRKIQERLERNQREAEILAKLSHVKNYFPSYHLLQCSNSSAAKYHRPREGLSIRQYNVGLITGPVMKLDLTVLGTSSPSFWREAIYFPSSSPKGGDLKVRWQPQSLGRFFSGWSISTIKTSYTEI